MLPTVSKLVLLHLSAAIHNTTTEGTAILSGDYSASFVACGTIMLYLPHTASLSWHSMRHIIATLEKLGR